MTPDIAHEILQSGDGWLRSFKYTEEERLEVNKIWETMPGNTCFYDALLRIAYPILYKLQKNLEVD